MRKYAEKAKTLAFSGTAKDTYVLFSGNIASSFLGFIFTLVVARYLTVSEFGVYSALTNFVSIIATVTDLGISAGIVRYVSENEAEGNKIKAKEYLKASLVVRALAVAIVIIPLFIFPDFVANKLMATSDTSLVILAVILAFSLAFWNFIPFALQAYKRFIASASVGVVVNIVRIGTLLALLLFGALNLKGTVIAFAVGAYAALGVGVFVLGTDFVKTKPKLSLYKRLLKFSGWVGVNRVVSAFAGKLDVQMLAAIAGATATGYYSISARVAFFIPMITSSLSSVLAPRLSSFNNKDKEFTYIKKAALVLFPITLGAIVWIIIAEPFIVILFGEKYRQAVPVLRALIAGMIPFLLTAPSVTAIVYALKKPKYIGVFSIIQLVAIVILNWLLIPKYGALGPAIALGLVHTALAIYTWTVVLKYYLVKSESRSPNS